MAPYSPCGQPFDVWIKKDTQPMGNAYAVFSRGSRRNTRNHVFNKHSPKVLIMLQVISTIKMQKKLSCAHYWTLKNKPWRNKIRKTPIVDVLPPVGVRSSTSTLLMHSMFSSKLLWPIMFSIKLLWPIMFSIKLLWPIMFSIYLSPENPVLLLGTVAHWHWNMRDCYSPSQKTSYH